MHGAKSEGYVGSNVLVVPGRGEWLVGCIAYRQTVFYDQQIILPLEHEVDVLGRRTHPFDRRLQSQSPPDCRPDLCHVRDIIAAKTRCPLIAKRQ
jgi:hypothetical protein